MSYRVLYVSQEVFPYIPENEMSLVARHLPQQVMELGNEMRTFMPRFGCVNERRHQLHEVIRLSGMNLIIDDTDHPLIIKVASIQPCRMQVYFIDNEEYFKRKATLYNEFGEFYGDNDERAIFFCRGVIETVKKLGWAPEIIHCQGWMSALMPLYIKKSFADDPIFADTAIVYSAFDNGFDEKLSPDFAQKVLFDGIKSDDVSLIDNGQSSFQDLSKLAMEYSDGIIMGSEKVDAELQEHAKSSGKPFLGYKTVENYGEYYNDLYEKVLDKVNVLAD